MGWGLYGRRLSLLHTKETDCKYEQIITIPKQTKSNTSLHFSGNGIQLNDDKEDVHSRSKKGFPRTAGGHGSVVETSGLMYLGSLELWVGVLVSLT